MWAADLLREHTGMGVTLAPTYGAHIPFVHVPLPLALGAAVGRALPDVVRTQVEGQAQAVLYGPALLLVSARRVQLNERTRPARRAAHRPARPAAASPRRPRARGRQRPCRLGRRRAAREGRVRARAVRARGADGAGRRPQRRRRSRRASTRCAPAGGSRTPAMSGSTTCLCADSTSSGRRPGGCRSGATCATTAPGRCGSPITIRWTPWWRLPDRRDLPSLAGCAYLNAGTNGPMPQAAIEAMAAEVRGRRAGPGSGRRRSSACSACARGRARPPRVRSALPRTRSR